MNLLIPHDLDEYKDKGCYLDRLALAYSKCGVRVTCGLEPFLRSDHHYDVVHVHWPEHFRWISRSQPPKECFNIYISKLEEHSRRSTCIWTVHNLFPHRHPLSPLYKQLYQNTIDIADGLVYHCSQSIKLLQERYRVSSMKHSIIVPHGNYSHMVTGQTKAEARHALGLSPDKKIFLFLGQLSPYKGPHLVLQAFRKIRMTSPGQNCSLVFCGWTGKSFYRGELISIALNWKWVMQGGWRFLAECPHGCRLFLGKKKEEYLATFLVASDVVVLGHQNVLTSGVPALAATFGKPVVVPEIGCIPAYVSRDGGVLYKAGDVASLERAMQRALNLNLAVTENAQLSLARQWNWQENTQRLVNWIENLTPNRQSGFPPDCVNGGINAHRTL